MFKKLKEYKFLWHPDILLIDSCGHYKDKDGCIHYMYESGDKEYEKVYNPATYMVTDYEWRPQKVSEKEFLNLMKG